MSSTGDNTESIRRVLIEKAGFNSSLLERDYHFADQKTISLAGFAYRPFDARSACIGVATSSEYSRNVPDFRQLGAPLLLVEEQGAFDLWRVGSKMTGMNESKHHFQ